MVVPVDHGSDKDLEKVLDWDSAAMRAEALSASGARGARTDRRNRWKTGIAAGRAGEAGAHTW